MAGDNRRVEAVGGATTGKQAREVLERVNRGLCTITAVITHNAAIAGMADRAIHISSGSITEIVRNEARIKP